ncbi:MAG: hypothetical protein AB2792_09960 [Candidatus Thiodiazotropha sp.]
MDSMIAVSRLDGCLYGLSIICGGISEYSAGAMLLNSADDQDSIHSAIVNYFPAEANFGEFSFDCCENGLGDLERDIQHYLLNNILGENVSDNADNIIDRRKYISFRIMDMVDLVIGDCPNPKVYKINAKINNSGSKCVFFAIAFNDHILALQFLHNNNQSVNRNI